MKTGIPTVQAALSKNFMLSDFLDEDEVFHIARVTITSGRDISFHSHNYAELFWIERGEGVHHINGYNLPLRKNDLVMIRPQDKHNFTAKGRLLTLVNIAFPRETLDYLKCRYFPRSEMFFWSKAILPFQLSLPDGLVNRFSARAEEAMLYKRSYLQLDSLLLFIFRQISVNESGLNYSSAPQWLVVAIQKYNNECLFKAGVSAFVELCNRNPDYINRIIREHFNQTLTDFINDIRIRHAVSQLLLTDIPIKTICCSCGFVSLAYFYKQFKKRYGTSPLKYREIHQKIV